MPESRPYVKEARESLNRHGIFAGFRDRIEPEDGVEIVVVRNSAPIDGLHVRGVAFAPESPACVVRYDVDNSRPGPGLGPLGPHLNILQPDPLGDHLHFSVLAEATRVWRVGEVVDFFLSPSFVDDLRRRLGTDGAR